jgi:hypothetical protein
LGAASRTLRNVKRIFRKTHFLGSQTVPGTKLHGPFG